MSVIDAERTFSGEMAYWHVVTATLTDVFGLQETKAAVMVRDLLDRMEDASPTERLMTFNTEPLHLAADLCGSEISEHTLKSYRALAKKLGRTRKPDPVANPA